ncbi:MAG TPA: hypothetical protein VMG12_31755 [Polyangiaceae bacterium]|nr:hypothetical protein [Polyangiaceae bacterium]
MNLADHLPSGFTLGDGLDARSAEQLASLAQVLERALPLEPAHPSAAARERSAKARAERARQLSAALEQALPLLEASRFDIQVLAVLLRLRIEADGLAGGLDALDVLARTSNEAWSALSEALAAKPPGERDKQRRKWARYVDAVFEQLYSWLARERERDERGLALAIAEAASRWSVALEGIERGLAAVALPVARFDGVEQGVRDLARAAEVLLAAEARASEAAAARAGDGAGRAAGGARRVSEVPAARGSVRPAPLVEPANDLRHDGRVSVEAAGALGERAWDAGASAELRVSSRFWELERRLAAFDALLARGEYEKAGIVEADLRESLEHFDVAAYFPGLFARYFEGCAAHAERLARHRPDSGALRASALTRLYRTDLERFLELREPSSK